MDKQNVNQQAMLESILNSMEALITVCDPETFNVIFLNDSIRKHFGITENWIGQKCYRVLQKLDAPCPACPYKRISEEPGLILKWEHTDFVKGSILRKTARGIAWPGMELAHLEYAVDITDERKAQAALEDRERQLKYQNNLLYAMSHMSAVLLQSDKNNFDKSLLDAIGIIAEATGNDSAHVWKNHTVNEELFCNQIFKWPQSSDAGTTGDLLTGISYREQMPDWEEKFKKRECVNGIVREMPDVERELLSARGVVSVFAVPIYLNNHFWGFLSFTNSHMEREFSKSEEEILRSAGELIAHALLRDRMEKSILRLEVEADKIFYDALTGICNRRFFEETILRLTNSLARSGGYLSLMMVDIDYFKFYNDTYGHIEGDNCLKIIAAALEESVTRVDDFVARYGGEEFVVVLPNTDENGAVVMANRVLENIRACKIPHRKSIAANHVTVSVGVATGNTENMKSYKDFIKAADEMLYVSKQNGRDRFTLTKLFL